MKDIQWIYLLDDRGSPVLVYKNKDQETYKPSYSILSHFLYGLKQNSRESEDTEIKIMDIENARYHLIEDKNSNVTFVVNTAWLLDSKKINSFLKEILKVYKKYFGGQEKVNLQKKQEIFQSFRDEIKTLF